MRTPPLLLGLLLLAGCMDFALPPAPAADDLDDDGFTAAGGDCDDHDRAINPTARDLCGDGVDQTALGAMRTAPPPTPIATASSPPPTATTSTPR